MQCLRVYIGSPYAPQFNDFDVGVSASRAGGGSMKIYPLLKHWWTNKSVHRILARELTARG